MSSQVTLKFIKGDLLGKEYEYNEKECLMLGRQDDCGIVIPEKTVSRAHCMLEICPPKARIKDFGSLNGTYLNNEKIGQRDRNMSIEEAKNLQHNEYDLMQGDTLSLGKDCTIQVSIYEAKFCNGCNEEIPQKDIGKYYDIDGEMICENCDVEYKKMKKQEEQAKEAARQAENERKKAEKKAKDLERRLKREEQKKEKERIEKEKRKQEEIARQKEQEKIRKIEQQKEIERKAKQRNKAKCILCGKSFQPKVKGDEVCPYCLKNPEKVLDHLLIKMIENGRDGSGGGGYVLDKYKKIKRLGKGGMGEVWLVEEEKTNKQYAFKLMLPQIAADKKSRNMFMREAHLGNSLKHKNVVKQIECGSSDGAFYILMELCKGGSVEDLIKRSNGRLDIDVANRIILQVLDGLEYVHNAEIKVKDKNGEDMKVHGVVHRDLKPANIFLSSNSQRAIVKVADFGLSKAFELSGCTDFTRTGTVQGTPVFMPRQQIANFKYSDPEVDVWAAAASYYYMLTGSTPKDIKGRDIWSAMFTQDAVPIRKRNPHIPNRLARVIDMALIDKPNIIFSSAGEFKKELMRAI